MLFNSIEFLIFLPLVFIGYWFIFGRKLTLQNLFIVGVSYLFYGWWDWRFLLLIAFTSWASWLSGLMMERRKESETISVGFTTFNAKRLICGINITINLLILGVFKYYNFFVDSFIDALGMFSPSYAEGVRQSSFSTLHIILPVGISFYTFQALSYSIDVYRQKLTATKSWIEFFAYVSFFPQLVAGPIERATNLLPQFQKERRFDYPKAVDGMRQILWGLFKKMVVADNCATMANSIFNNYEMHNGSTLVLGAIFFSFQIYGDFSGYSDIAIGTARLFGIDLMRNFNFPYFSRDIAEFWRRWHISLTTWFRDYIYIPLGGSRVGKEKAMRNTFVIFLVSGLWHGANWTFILWGAYHALLFVPLLLTGSNRRFTNTVAQDKILPSLRELWQMGATFALAAFGWIIFRAENIGQAYHYIQKIFSTTLFTIPGNKEPIALASILILLGVEWMQRNNQHGFSHIAIKRRPLRWILYLFILWSIFEFAGQNETFIYFQF